MRLPARSAGCDIAPSGQKPEFVISDITNRSDFIDSDPISPGLIEHKVEEIYIDGQLEQVYNFIDYWFDCDAGRLRARAYLDTPHEATVYPAIREGTGHTLELGEDPAVREAVILYLSRRYMIIKDLAVGPIWMATNTRRYFESPGWDIEDEGL
jgi:hypothetical protein